MFAPNLDHSLISILGFVIGLETWFEPKPGLNVVYGKNGVGKSTLVNFIETICDSGRASKDSSRSNAEGGAGRVVVGLIAPGIVEWADSIAREIEKLSGSWRKIRAFDDGFRRYDKEIINHLVPKATEEHEWSDIQVYQELSRVTGEGVEEIERAIASLRADSDSAKDNNFGLVCELTRQILQGRFDAEMVSQITNALRTTLRYHYTEWSLESAGILDINERLAKYGIPILVVDEFVVTANNLESFRFGELFILFVDVIIGRLQYELNDVIIDVEEISGEQERLENFNTGKPLTFSSVRNDADEVIGIVARAIYEQLSNPLISYNREFTDGYSVRLLFKTDGISNVGEHTTTLEKLRLTWNEVLNGQESRSFEDQVLAAWLYSSLVLCVEKFEWGTKATDSLPFYELSFSLGKLQNLPFDLIRLDRDFDIPTVVAGLAAETLGKDFFEALAFLEEDEAFDDQLSTFVKPLNDAFEPVSRFIASMGIGIDGLRAVVSPWVNDWLSGNGIVLRCSIDTYELGFERLSTAQQYWVKAALLLVAASKSNTPVVVIADEPDQSLHERAAFSVMESLVQSGLDVIVSSHSVAALRTRNATLHHLEVGPRRQRTITDVAIGEDVLVAAERLGTTPYDLLSLKRMMVLVEGSHDAAVVGKLIKTSDIHSLLDRVLVVPMRGVRNVMSAADSILVTEFSDLNVLVIVDNGRNEVFKPLLDDLRERYAAGATEKELKQVLASRRLGLDISYEERTLFDLLERAIHRGILNRLELYAFSVGDVVELLPASKFGSQLGWDELRRDYSANRLGMDFKSWLRETHKISVSVRTVERAFEEADALHPELIRLLQQIELGSSVA